MSMIEDGIIHREIFLNLHDNINPFRLVELPPDLIKSTSPSVNKEKYPARFWIENPIPCGYLYAYSLSQYCSENISYLMAIESFKDMFDAEKLCWTVPWVDIDSRVDLNSVHEPEDIEQSLHAEPRIHSMGVSSPDWPSSIINESSVVSMVKVIWTQFLSPTAPYQICVSSDVLNNTKKRMMLLHLYGRSVFEETTIDPLKTISRDLIPRFLSSSYYENMIIRMKKLSPLPSADSLKLKLPPTSSILCWKESELRYDTLQIELQQLLHDRILFRTFLKYLQSIYVSEYLLCARSLTIYDGYWIQSSRKTESSRVSAAASNVEDMAWTIYLYFIASGSAYEITIEDLQKKKLLQQLANPTAEIFKDIEKSILSTLSHHYQNYFRSDFFSSLRDVVLKEQQKVKFNRSHHAKNRWHTGSRFRFFNLYSMLSNNVKINPGRDEEDSLKRRLTLSPIP